MLTVIVGIGAEEVSKNLGVGRGLSGPQIPNFVGQGISDKIVLFAFEHIIRTDIRWLCVGVFASVHGLRRDEAKVLTPQKPT